MPIMPFEALTCTENPHPGRVYTVEFIFPEFTSIYPPTGFPDFATVTVRYVPGKRCVETGFLKQYLNSYREAALFAEASVNRILDDLVAACAPREMTVVGAFNVRGGIASVVKASYCAEDL